MLASASFLRISFLEARYDVNAQSCRMSRCLSAIEPFKVEPVSDGDNSDLVAQKPRSKSRLSLVGRAVRGYAGIRVRARAHVRVPLHAVAYARVCTSARAIAFVAHRWTHEK